MRSANLYFGPVEALEGRVLLAADAVLEWNEVLLDAIRAEGTPPPYAARNMAIVHAAVFDAVNAIDGRHEPYLVHRRAPKGASLEAAGAQAAHDTLVALYPSRTAAFDTALVSSLAAVPDGPAETQGIAVGRAVARHILAAREDDGADEVVDYSPGSDPSDWVPTPPAFAAALLPQWPAVEPFAMGSSGQFRPGPPPDITSMAFAASLDQVRRLGAADSTERTAYEADTALFWADGAGTSTPPGHWNRIAAEAAASNGNTLVENARLFALLNVALADAGIVAWDAKYAYDLCRPVTAIHNAGADGNPLTEADPQWSPLIATPPFPSYTSGHSTFSAAAAAVLAGFFGTDAVQFTAIAEGTPRPMQRTFGGFWEAAEEAGMSRVYGGIHYDFDNVEGLRSGRALGTFVFDSLMRPIETARGKHGKGESGGRSATAASADAPLTGHGPGRKADSVLSDEQDVLGRTFRRSESVFA